jgi:hypothetical protein
MAPPFVRFLRSLYLGDFPIPGRKTISFLSEGIFRGRLFSGCSLLSAGKFEVLMRRGKPRL